MRSRGEDSSAASMMPTGFCTSMWTRKTRRYCQRVPERSDQRGLAEQRGEILQPDKDPLSGLGQVEHERFSVPISGTIMIAV